MDTTTPSTPASAHDKRILDAVAAGRTLGDIAGTDPNELEAIYRTGYELYSGGRYEDAAALFGYLAVHAHTDRRYAMAYAGALQMSGDYGNALRMYMGAAMLDFGDPQASFHIAECLLSLGMRPEARDALQAAISQSENEPAHAELQARTKALLALVDAQPTTPTRKEKSE